MEIRSPAVRSMSSSRGGRVGETSSASRMRSSVNLPIAETTTTTSLPAAFVRDTCSATARIRSASPHGRATKLLNDERHVIKGYLRHSVPLRRASNVAPMATSKRERQKAARRLKIEQMQRQAKRRQNIRRGVIFGIVAVLVLGAGTLLFSSKSTTTTTTTSTTAPTSATTTTVATTPTTIPKAQAASPAIEGECGRCRGRLPGVTHYSSQRPDVVQAPAVTIDQVQDLRGPFRHPRRATSSSNSTRPPRPSRRTTSSSWPSTTSTSA